MVHLNGHALPDADSNSTEFNGSSALHNPSNPPRRRARSLQTACGPKPLLPRSLKEALQLAELLSKSKLIPKGFETPETCLVGILYGMEVGLSPIAALQRMAVIDGRPTIWGDAALALVQASGLLTSIEEEIIDEAETHDASALASASTSRDPSVSTMQLTAFCRVKREGRSETTIGTFSTEDAIRAHLWQKPGPWTDYPKRMLMMRARAFALRDAFPDVLAGLYIREEFEGAEKRYANQTTSPVGSPAPKDPAADDAEWEHAGTSEAFGKTEPNQPLKNNDLSDQPRINAGQRSLRRAPPPPPQPLESETDEAKLGIDRFDTVKIDRVQSDPKESPNTELALGSEDHNSGSDLIDPETLLDLFDSALCCALDFSTLEEIVDDFAERLKRLPREIQERAQRIIERHQTRVEEIDRSFKTGRILDLNDEQSLGKADTPHDDHSRPLKNTEADLPKGLKALLPNLGLGHLPLIKRRRRASNGPSRSLVSWHIRQRLPEFKFTHTGQSDMEHPNDQEAQP